ncbi:glycoside hydrolase family 3 C-terminal domain-containing protein [Actinophytocola sp.]|uniref:glycoside hydrolase family 3 C-terminal domain-containing protein n=1 Tax=Actinophytocola sp. TaxID=1872138 RepID=UPI0039C89D16
MGVGTNSQVESEGHDRANLDLPGRQNDLVRAVAATGTPTVVIVNAGSTVVLPWANEVAAILQGYFGGQEFGHAIADVLTGAAEPGGRLPTTWPAALCDVPVTEVQPVNGRLVYREGLHIGYRAWLRDSVEPAFPFGHGLGYTTWSWNRARRHDDTLQVALTNTGARAGKQVVQVYVTATIPVPPRRLAHWTGQWVVEPGTYILHAGASVAGLPLSVALEIAG